jgi:uncharacterized RDD family membrane protein YckC
MPQDYVIVTPENMDLRYRLAGVGSRGFAWIYDTFFQILVLMGLGFLQAMLLSMLSRFLWGGLIDGLYVASVFCLVWFYHVFFETFFQGQTPGKQIMGIRVVTVEGRPVSFFSSIIRNLLRGVDFLPVLNCGGVFCMLVSPHHQRIGDALARTIVIRDDRISWSGKAWSRPVETRKSAPGVTGSRPKRSVFVGPGQGMPHLPGEDDDDDDEYGSSRGAGDQR